MNHMYLLPYILRILDFDFGMFVYMFTDEEKKLVADVFSNAIDCLSDEDKKLPQVICKFWPELPFNCINQKPLKHNITQCY